MNWALSGAVLLIVGNFFASLSDVAVKLLDGGISAPQYVFLRQLCSLLLILPFWLRQNKEQRSLANVRTTLVRSHLILIGSGCMMVAITHLPLATANAVFYAAPLLMLPLGILFFGETVSMKNGLLTLIGFAGVILVLRPDTFHWAAYFALGTACALALFNLLARTLPKEQTVITTLFWTSLFSLPVAAIASGFHWQPVSVTEIGLVAISASLILSYNGLAVIAYKRSEASQIALAEYSGLVFVVIIGVVQFQEYLDLLSTLGIMLIIGPLLLKTKRNY